ncbi:hypothetical protein ABH932_001591 [Streptacidiphilus sp. MAP5-52]
MTDIIPTAKAQRWDPAEVVRVLLAEEAAGRDRANLHTRRKRAGFPTGKTFGDWDEGKSSIPRATQDALKTLEWVGRRESFCICGPSGTGKSHFTEALGQTAVEAGLAVSWFTIQDLGSLVRRHRADDSIARALSRIIRSDLIIVDDIGLLPVSEDAAEDLHARHGPVRQVLVAASTRWASASTRAGWVPSGRAAESAPQSLIRSAKRPGANSQVATDTRRAPRERASATASATVGRADAAQPTDTAVPRRRPRVWASAATSARAAGSREPAAPRTTESPGPAPASASRSVNAVRRVEAGPGGGVTTVSLRPEPRIWAGMSVWT